MSLREAPQFFKHVMTCACLKKCFPSDYSQLSGRFVLNKGDVMGYVWYKYSTKQGMQIPGMFFQTRSGAVSHALSDKLLGEM